MAFILSISSCSIVGIRDRSTSAEKLDVSKEVITYKEDINVILNRKDNVITIETNKLVNYKVFTLKNPERVVLDIYGSFDVKVNSMSKDINYRLGYHPWGFRLVIDTPYTKVQDKKSSSGLSIVIFLPAVAQNSYIQTKQIPKVELPVKGVVQPAERGIFIKTSCDDFFRAVEDGNVIYAGRGLKQYDWIIMVKQKNGFISVYAKASNSFVKKGEVVKKYQVLGKVGRSGDKCGILYELRTEDGSPIKFEVVQ